MVHTLLSAIPLFASLSPDELEALASVLRPRHCKENEIVYRFGDHGEELFLIQVGHIQTSCPDHKGRSVAMTDLGPGDFFGEVGLLDAGPRAETTRAMSDVSMVCLSRNDLLDLLERSPAVSSYMVSVLAGRLRETQDKLHTSNWRQ